MIKWCLNRWIQSLHANLILAESSLIDTIDFIVLSTDYLAFSWISSGDFSLRKSCDLSTLAILGGEASSSHSFILSFQLVYYNFISDLETSLSFLS